MARYECIKLDCKLRGVCESIYDIDSPPCAKLDVEKSNIPQQTHGEIKQKCGMKFGFSCIHAVHGFCLADSTWFSNCEFRVV